MDRDWPWLALETPLWSNPYLRYRSVRAIRSVIRESPDVNAGLEISPEEGYLEALKYLDDLEAALKRERALIVETARARGVSWNAIARKSSEVL